AAAGVIYGLATVAHGSGFLAVFVAGLLIGDARAPYKAEIEHFHTSLAAIAEIVAFVALGLTINLTDLGSRHLWLDGLLLAPLLPSRLRVPSRVAAPEPWRLPARLGREPQGVQRHVVARGARAEGEQLRHLPLGEHSWVSLIVRGDEPRQARGSHVFEPGDEVLLLTDREDATALRHLFEGFGS